MSGAGKIAGSAAVSFLTKSGISMILLKAVWAASDSKNCHALELPQFYVALRYIQILQRHLAQTGGFAGIKVSPELIDQFRGKELKLPRFEGIDGPPVPPPSSLAGPSGATGISDSSSSAKPPSSSSALATQDQYAMTSSERARYDTLFPTYSTNNDGYIYGSEAVALFTKSGLDRQTLRQIW